MSSVNKNWHATREKTQQGREREDESGNPSKKKLAKLARKVEEMKEICVCTPWVASLRFATTTIIITGTTVLPKSPLPLPLTLASTRHRSPPRRETEKITFTLFSHAVKSRSHKKITSFKSEAIFGYSHLTWLGYSSSRKRERGVYKFRYTLGERAPLQ